MNQPRFTRSIAIMAVLMAATLITARAAKAGPTGLSAPQFKSMLDHGHDSGDLILLDIRTPREFAGGHIRGAVLIDYYAGDFIDRLKKLDRRKTYLIYCRSGNRTGKSMEIFEKLGFSRVYHLERGLLSWVQEKYPLVRSAG